MFSFQVRCLRLIGSSYKGFLINRSCKGAKPEIRSMSSLDFSQGDANRLIWVDMEMTGLNPDTDRILEIACVITDSQLNIISESPNLIIHQPEEVLRSMNDWCVKHHVTSGLWDASVESKLTIEEAESKLLDFVKTYTPHGKCPLAGNSVYGDRMFMRKYMPRFDNHIHYRLVDVSTVKELCRRWFPAEYDQAPRKVFAHRSLSDIRESIEELKYYKNTVFNLHAEPMGSNYIMKPKPICELNHTYMLVVAGIERG